VRRKPRVLTKCVANAHSAPNERIIEYSAGTTGGLISFRLMDDGKLYVDLYRHDKGVVVRVGDTEEE
jgi:hypothetical protein